MSGLRLIVISVIITTNRIGSSVADPERGAVLGPALAPVVEAGGADVGVAEPVLDAGDVGLVLEGALVAAEARSAWTMRSMGMAAAEAYFRTSL